MKQNYLIFKSNDLKAFSSFYIIYNIILDNKMFVNKNSISLDVFIAFKKVLLPINLTSYFL